MRARGIVLIVGVLAASVLAHVLTSENFGRPAVVDRTFIGTGDRHRAGFALCAGPVRANCVVDGDTFWFEDTKIRIADIDAPEISVPRCSAEGEAGEAATRRLLELLNAGPFSLATGWRDEDRFGRKLRIVARDRVSLGELLVREGLARSWEGPRLDWCS